ncbi:MAG: 4Fe-4S binding protein [Bacillota bacterium]
MKIAILSGKGGTGKTTLSTNLFTHLEGYTLIDTDIEEPNSHLFLDYVLEAKKPVHKAYPVIDGNRCTLCGKCGEHCNFNAIIVAPKKVIVSEDLCHSCGFCKAVCPENAITYAQKSIGDIYQTSTSSHKPFYYGLLNTGEVSGVRLVESLKAMTVDVKNLLIDCPPGAACTTAASIEGVDKAIVVSEPTPFGVSDMKIVVELLRDAGIEFGVVINKAGSQDREIYDYLEKEHIPLYGEILYKASRARHYSNGELLIHHDEAFKETIRSIANRVLEGETHA